MPFLKAVSYGNVSSMFERKKGTVGCCSVIPFTAVHFLLGSWVQHVYVPVVVDAFVMPGLVTISSGKV